MVFSSGLGVSGISQDGRGIDGIFDLMGNRGTVVIGPATPDRHVPT